MANDFYDSLNEYFEECKLGDFPEYFLGWRPLIMQSKIIPILDFEIVNMKLQIHVKKRGNRLSEHLFLYEL